MIASGKVRGKVITCHCNSHGMYVRFSNSENGAPKMNQKTDLLECAREGEPAFHLIHHVTSTHCKMQKGQASRLCKGRALPVGCQKEHIQTTYVQVPVDMPRKHKSTERTILYLEITTCHRGKCHKSKVSQRTN